tara:strand:- start:23 stop:442 length:420 start_codon:yes stop_codon:yes gene_type:complete
LILNKDRLLIKKYVISFASLLIIFITLIIFQFSSFDTTVRISRNISSYFLKSFRQRFNFNDIFFISRKINRMLGINSCFKICLSQKIIFSIFGYDVKIISGIKKTEDDILDGHAWLSYKERPILERNENIDQYLESFVI